MSLEIEKQHILNTNIRLEYKLKKYNINEYEELIINNKTYLLDQQYVFIKDSNGKKGKLYGVYNTENTVKKLKTNV